MEQEQSVCALYIGHTVFKLDTKEKIYIKRITKIPITGDFIKNINQISEGEGQSEGIKFSDYHRNITVLNFLLNHREDDSNASDKSFKFDDTYQKEFDKQLDQENQFMKMVNPVKPDEADPNQIIQGIRKRSVVNDLVNQNDELHVEVIEPNKEESDTNLNQHGLEDNTNEKLKTKILW